MTTRTPARALPDMLFLSGRRATRYPTVMPKKHDDPLYTVARFTTTQAAEMLGIKRATVYTAIQRGFLETALGSPGTHLISQAAIDAYRANHLGQVGQPTRKRQRMLNKLAEAQARKATDAAETTPVETSVEAMGTPDADDEKEEV